MFTKFFIGFMSCLCTLMLVESATFMEDRGMFGSASMIFQDPEAGTFTRGTSSLSPAHVPFKITNHGFVARLKKKPKKQDQKIDVTRSSSDERPVE